MAFLIGFRWAQRVRERRAGLRRPARWPEWVGLAVLAVVVTAVLRIEASRLVADGLAAVLFALAVGRRPGRRDGGRRGRADGADDLRLLPAAPQALADRPVRPRLVEARR